MYSIVMYVHIATVEIHIYSYVYIDQSKTQAHYNNNIINSSLTKSLPIAT